MSSDDEEDLLGRLVALKSKRQDRPTAADTKAASDKRHRPTLYAAHQLTKATPSGLGRSLAGTAQSPQLLATDASQTALASSAWLSGALPTLDEADLELELLLETERAQQLAGLRDRLARLCADQGLHTPPMNAFERWRMLGAWNDGCRPPGVAGAASAGAACRHGGVATDICMGTAPGEAAAADALLPSLAACSTCPNAALGASAGAHVRLRPPNAWLQDDLCRAGISRRAAGEMAEKMAEASGEAAGVLRARRAELRAEIARLQAPGACHGSSLARSQDAVPGAPTMRTADGGPERKKTKRRATGPSGGGGAGEASDEARCGAEAGGCRESAGADGSPSLPARHAPVQVWDVDAEAVRLEWRGHSARVTRAMLVKLRRLFHHTAGLTEQVALAGRSELTEQGASVGRDGLIHQGASGGQTVAVDQDASVARCGGGAGSGSGRAQHSGATSSSGGEDPTVLAGKDGPCLAGRCVTRSGADGGCGSGGYGCGSGGFECLGFAFEPCGVGTRDQPGLDSGGDETSGCGSVLPLAPNCLERKFLLSALWLLLRYESIGCAGMHAAIGGGVHAVLRARLGVRFECCASPLNAYHGAAAYCSAFSDTDAAFGSVGSFSGFEPTRGAFELNPPFVPGLIDAAADHVLRLLSRAAAVSEPLTFVLVLPGWVDSLGYAAVAHSPHTRKQLVVAAVDHGFVDGAVHARPSSYRQSPFDTCVFVCQTEPAAAHAADGQLLAELERALAACTPTPEAIAAVPISERARGGQHGRVGRKQRKRRGGGKAKQRG